MSSISDPITEGIVRAVRGEFGAETDVFTENIEQGLSPPCFSVRRARSSEERFLGDRFLSRNEFLITYFPRNPDSNSDISEICARLFSALEMIRSDEEFLRGTDMSYSIKDGTAVFSVRYSFFFYRKTDIEKMGECAVFQNIENSEARGD